MKYSTTIPHPALTKYIQGYWAIEIDSKDHEDFPRKQWVFPGLHFDLIIQVGRPAFFSHDNSKWYKREPIAFLEGHFDKYLILNFAPNTRLYGITFKPLGVFPFINDNTTQFNNKFTPIESVFGNVINELVEQVAETDSFYQVKRLFDKFLFRLINPKIKSLPHVHNAFNLILESFGTMHVSCLAKEVYASERKLQRDFKEYIGVSMERMCKMIRYRRMLQILKYEKINSFYELCARLNYHDLSHLFHDFKKYSGVTPKSLSTKKTAISQALVEIDPKLI